MTESHGSLPLCWGPYTWVDGHLVLASASRTMYTCVTVCNLTFKSRSTSLETNSTAQQQKARSSARMGKKQTIDLLMACSMFQMGSAFEKQRPGKTTGQSVPSCGLAPFQLQAQKRIPGRQWAGPHRGLRSQPRSGGQGRAPSIGRRLSVTYWADILSSAAVMRETPDNGSPRKKETDVLVSP